jgi:hypothetical protein
LKPEDLIWLPDIVDKLIEKHQVETFEVEEVLPVTQEFLEDQKVIIQVRMYITLWDVLMLVVTSSSSSLERKWARFSTFSPRHDSQRTSSI